MSESTALVRLQKVMAAAGVGSRRKCEVLIEQGRVRVNGQLVTEQGKRVDPARDQIEVDGSVIATHPDVVVLALNKPRGVVSAMSDDRPCLDQFVPEDGPRLFHVGRLDAETTGLLLLTNSGDLAEAISHPRLEIDKTYQALVQGQVKPGTLKNLRSGIELKDGPAHVDRITIVDQRGSQTLLRLSIHSGRNRIVRRMLAHVGHPVQELTRTAIGPIQLGQLKVGDTRQLNQDELNRLYTLTRSASPR